MAFGTGLNMEFKCQLSNCERVYASLEDLEIHEVGVHGVIRETRLTNGHGSNNTSNNFGIAPSIGAADTDVTSNNSLFAQRLRERKIEIFSSKKKRASHDHLCATNTSVYKVYRYKLNFRHKI